MALWYGRYRAESELSRGGLGVLCCAVDPGQGLQALVKALVLPSSCDAARREEWAARFRREAKAIRGLKHPSLPRVYEIGESHGLPYVAVRRVPGTTLREETTSRGRLDPDRARRLAIDLLGALEQMHAVGVFQGPLRAEAILLPRSGDAPQLLDWGFAQAEPDAPDPEAAPTLDARGDILQAGILLHEMVTGRSPFGPATPGPTGTPRVDPSLPADLRRILYVALAADPAQRFAGAAEMARALSGGPVPALRTPAASDPNARQSAAPAAASAIAADAGPADGPKCPQCDSPVGDGDLQCPVCRQMLPVRVRSDREHASSGQAPGPRRLDAPVAGTKGERRGRRKWAWALAIPLAALLLFLADEESRRPEPPAVLPPVGAPQPVRDEGAAVRQRVQAAGGASGDIQCSLAWDNWNDLDLWVGHNGEYIGFRHERSIFDSGCLDIDMNVHPTTPSPCENIRWATGSAPSGDFVVYVHHYMNHGSRDPTAFTVRVSRRGQVSTFAGSVGWGDPPLLVTSFREGRNTGPWIPGEGQWFYDHLLRIR